MKIPADFLARSARSKGFGAVLLAYFALFWLFAILSWKVPTHENATTIFVSALSGAWMATILVWLGSDGRSDDSWLRGQILLGIALDLVFNTASGKIGDKVLSATCTSAGNLGILMAAIGVGVWVARGLLKPNYLVMAAIVAALTDIFSVYAGPTKSLMGTVAFEFLAFAWGLIGQGGVSGIVGVGDFIFLALFFNGVRRFGLDDRKTLAAMGVAIALGFLSTLISPQGIPGLPFFAVALLLVHGRELKAKMQEG